MGLLKLIPICEGLHKRYELVFLFIGQPQVADRRVHVLWNLRGGPARRLFSRSAMLTTGKFIAGVVEVDDFFQALKVAVVHIGLDEIGTRSLVHIPQCRDLELAADLTREPRPITTPIDPRIPEEGAYSFVPDHSARRAGDVSVFVRI